MPGNANLSIRIDSALKAQAEEVLSELGMTMTGAFTMFLKQIVREGAVPLSLSLDSSNALYADLLEARTARLDGYQGRDGFDVLSDMRTAIDTETGNGKV